jgi:predicted nucleic acid-binding protein
MIVVLDASAAIEILLKKERNDIFRDVMNSAEKIITSDFFMIEVANVLRKYYSVYDMLYFILAKRYKAVLLTCDGPLNRIADKEGITIARV